MKFAKNLLKSSTVISPVCQSNDYIWNIISSKTNIFNVWVILSENLRQEFNVASEQKNWNVLVTRNIYYTPKGNFSLNLLQNDHPKVVVEPYFVCCTSINTDHFLILSFESINSSHTSLSSFQRYTALNFT